MYQAVPHTVSVHTRINKRLLRKVDNDTVAKAMTRTQILDLALRKFYGIEASTKRRTKAGKKAKR